MKIERLPMLLAPVLLAVLNLSGCAQNVASDASTATTAGQTTTVPKTGIPHREAKGLPGSQANNDSFAGNAQTVSSGVDNGNLLLGNPSRAGREPNNYLVERPQHALSYNKSNGGPNWVSWHLQKRDLGSVRRGDFLPDPLLPPDMQIRPGDYRGSGYDRGHVCPSGDRTRTKADNTATFVMSNMLPQAAELNQQVWKDLEEYERYLAMQTGARASELYIIAGGSGSAERIAGGKVNVPAVCWKIIVVLPVGDNDLGRINADTRVIAVSMPNRQRQEIADSKWSEWITSVAQLEKTTGYDFLSALPDNIEKALEAKVDSGRAQGSARRTTGRNPSTGYTGSQDRTARNERTTHAAAPQPVRHTDGFETTSSPVPGQDSPQVRAANADSVVAQSPSQTAPDQQVWVNTRSGIYHYRGARWYGTTKNGEYMSEGQALAAGYRAAMNGQ